MDENYQYNYEILLKIVGIRPMINNKKDNSDIDIKVSIEIESGVNMTTEVVKDKCLDSEFMKKTINTLYFVFVLTIVSFPCIVSIYQSISNDDFKIFTLLPEKLRFRGIKYHFHPLPRL